MTTVTTTTPHCGWRHCINCNDADGNPTRPITGTSQSIACSVANPPTRTTGRAFDENHERISIGQIGDDTKLYHLRCTCGYYFRSDKFPIEFIVQLAADHKVACDGQYAKRRQATTDRRIADYREERDICIAALEKWTSTPLGAKFKSLAGVRRMEYRRWMNRVQNRIDVLRDLEGIDYRDLDAADGVKSLVS